MTTEEAVAKAWYFMRDWGMPAGVAIDHVMETGVERGEATRHLLVAGVAHTANARPSARQETGGSFPDFEAGKICAAMSRGDFEFAETILKNLKARLLQQELNPTSLVTSIGEWIDWCGGVTRAVRLARQILEAKEV